MRPRAGRKGVIGGNGTCQAVRGWVKAGAGAGAPIPAPAPTTLRQTEPPC